MVRTRNKRKQRRVERAGLSGLWSIFLLLIAGVVLYQSYLKIPVSPCKALAKDFQVYDRITDNLAALVVRPDKLTEEELEVEDEAIQAVQKLWETMKGEAEQCLK